MGLILGIIGILVIAAGLGASIYYGGDSYVDSTIKAEANTFLSEASQVRTGVTLYRAHELAFPDPATAIADLITERHLGSNPSNTFALSSAGQITSVSTNNANLTADVCAKIEEEATGVDVDPTALPVDDTAAVAAGQLYGCFGNATTRTMFFN